MFTIFNTYIAGVKNKLFYIFIITSQLNMLLSFTIFFLNIIVGIMHVVYVNNFYLKYCVDNTLNHF